jgi:hypothetical protein
MIRRLALPAALLAAVGASAQNRDAPSSVNDYPTATRADYVLGCMAANNNTREALLQCSCAIDVIAGIIPFSDYEKVETALSLQRGGGERAALFRDPPMVKALIEHLREAQAEADLQCFR